ncbi:hypothetical protein PS627_01480 [Pseudomonas fluorescens]|uniref:head completion/stabilization protein n=1 Tax=Pseudomonas fluorescens TaxID=294 RepID=UPI00125B06B8|nr:head completion/stabilization protein [Pseudomonas fluorescens]CAG8865562.1 hypothetical protein PS627_01480 [Pseudomonas fluorescens]VVP86168.1 hypothetical protein PS910_02427 [Pseudomonas fluorescens]
MARNSDLEHAVDSGAILDRDDPFWPRIGLAQLRETLALAPGITDAHLRAVAQMAARQVASDLAQRRWLARAQGGCPRDRIGLVSALRRCYLRRIESGVRRALHRGVVVEVDSAGGAQEA